MYQNFLLVDKSILPDYYEKVIKARALLSSGKIKDVSEAVKMVGISRSTYYKYKDYIYVPGDDPECRKAVISFTLPHRAGSLSEVLGILSESGANILTITQNPPIHSHAHVVVSLDISRLSLDADALIAKISAIDGVFGAKVISIK